VQDEHCCLEGMHQGIQHKGIGIRMDKARINLGVWGRQQG
jgi:hypothetical protein